MHRESHSWVSAALGQEMSLNVYGSSGKPVIVFPSQRGRFHDFEDFGMVESVSSFIEAGEVRLFTVDSVDAQSWGNEQAHPAERARRHQDYDRYIVEEAVPFIRRQCGGTDQLFLSTGVSMGGFHSANFFFRHPDVFDALIAMSGVYRADYFVGDYMDDNVYFNSPLDYLPGLDDPWYLERFRRSRIIVGVGQGAWEDRMVRDTADLRDVLAAKKVPAWVDFWGYDVNHDWPWWRKMFPYFMGSLRRA